LAPTRGERYKRLAVEGTTAIDIGKGKQPMALGTIDRRASLRRAAILMTSFEEPVARALLGQLPPLERARLRRAMADLEDVDPLERRRAQAEFVQATRQQVGGAPQGTTPPARTLGNEAVELQFKHREEAEPAADRGASEAPPLAFLSDVPDDSLLGAIIGEHPQTIAIVLASLAPHQAARLLPGLSDSLRAEALRRLARLEHLPPDALDSIGDHLRRLLADATPRAVGVGAGGRSLHAILAEMPQQTRRGVAEELGIDPQTLPASEPSEPEAPAAVDVSESDAVEGPEDATAGAAPEPASLAIDSIQLDRLLGRLSTDRLREALAQLETREALLALCGFPRKEADRVLRSLPRRQAKQIRQQLAGLGTLTIGEVDQAKQHVVEMAGAWEAATGGVPGATLAAA